MVTYDRARLILAADASFAIYHADQEDGSSAHPSATGYDYHELVALAFRSAAIFHPGCRRFLLTDEHTRWEDFDPDIEIRRSAIASDRFNLARFEAEVSFVRDAPDTALVVIMDSDVLVHGALDDLVDETWDIALTYRDHDEWPINKGVIAINGRRRASALVFLERVHRHYVGDTRSDSAWWGDQRALIEALGRADFFARSEDRMNIDGVAVRLLPCDIYNFSPDTGSFGRPLVDKRVVHFKGERKAWMKPYWLAHLAWRESATPASLFAAALWRWRLRARRQL